MMMTMMIDYTTTSYQTETPRCLWKPWTNGPGDDPERYSDRLTALIARDLLEEVGDELDEEVREYAEDLAAEVCDGV